MTSILLLALLLQTASLQGIVVKYGTDEPLSRATIELRKADAGPLPYTVVTTDDGKFLFPNLPAGDYRVIATRPGYVPADRAATFRPGQTAPIELAMAPTGAIYGRIFDEHAKPLVSATVQALKSTFEDGRRRFDVVQTTLTNDLGEYRLFWLPPGGYYVAVLPPVDGNPNNPRNSLLNNPAGTGGLQFIMRSNPSRTNPAPTVPATTELEMMVYFPGTTSEQSAALIDVRSGSNVGSADIPFVRGRPRRLRGVVVDGTTGQAAGGAVLTMERYPRFPGGGVSSQSVAVDPDNGSFDIPRVAPGSYVLVAKLGSADGLAGRAMIDVGDADVDNLTIVMNMGLDLAGRIVSDNRQFDLTNLRVNLVPDASVLERPVPAGTPASDGSFLLRAVPPENYRVRISVGGRSVYVKSIRMGAADILNGGLRLDAPSRAPLEIVIGTNPGRVVGAVSTGRAGPTEGATVVLMPDAAHQHRVDLYQSAVTDAAGKFQMAGVPPGDYLVFAWEQVERGAWFDPEFMKIYEIRGIPLHIDEGMQLDIDVPAITARP